MVTSLTKEKRLLTLRLNGLGRLGEALAEADGKQVFVFGGIPGEHVVAEVIRERRGYIAAQVVEVLEASPHRRSAPCRYFGACTGCQWQHITYEHQLEMKRGIVVDALERIAGLDAALVQATLASPSEFHYRNHARFTVSQSKEPSAHRSKAPFDKSEDSRRQSELRANGEGTASAAPVRHPEQSPPRRTESRDLSESASRAQRDDAPPPGRLGYVHRELRRHVAIDDCMLMAPWINEAVASLQGKAGETTQLSLRYGVNTGSWMLQPTFQDTVVPLASGQKHYEESLLGYTFRVSSPSFFQVNTHQAEQMARLVLQELALTGRETVVDAYAGVATFAVLAARSALRVLAVEESASALEDAKVNVEGIPNIELRKAKTEDVLREMAAQGVDAVILDPPRAGCMPGTLEALLESPPAKIVYVSCDPESLARDLRTLTAGPFTVRSVQPMDMFPQTHHVECLCVLTLDPERQAALAARRQLVLASGSPRRKEILSNLGLAFDLLQTDVPEPPHDPSDGGPGVGEALARERALAKARAGASAVNAGTVIGADTVVELDDGVLGKPADASEARRMLAALRGREHRVISAMALIDAATGETEEGFRATRVRMRDYSDAEVDAYVASGDPLDKAGAYAVQSESFRPAAEVRGCYLNVVGLPACTFLKLAERFGLRLDVPDAGSYTERTPCAQCVRHMDAQGVS